MRKVLLDGETFYTISQIGQTNYDMALPIAKESLFNFILALLLWDEIYVFDPCHNSYPTIYSEFFSKYKSLFTELTLSPGLIEFLQKANIKLRDVNPDISPDNEILIKLDELDKRGLLKERGKTLLGRPPIKKCSSHISDKEIDDQSKEARALDYWWTANVLGLDYMPSVSRQILLRQFDIDSVFLRKDVIDKLDQELLHFYDCTNGHLVTKKIHFNTSVLLDYIFQQATTDQPDEILEKTIDLRYSSKVVNFRKELNELDDAWSSGNIKHINEYFWEIENIIKKLGDPGENHKLNITISFPPAISFDINFPKRRPVQAVFLKELANFGLKKRRWKRNN